MRYRRGPRERVWDIDVVYLWSDPSDPVWAERRQQVLDGETRDDFCRIGIQTTRPSGSLDELRYSLRSVDRYLRGVRLGSESLSGAGAGGAWKSGSLPLWD